MHINPSLTGPQNIIAYATNPAFTAPTDPNNVLCGTPLPFPPPSGFTEIPGVNIDGANSNTMVDVYITDLLEDVNEDGATQTIIYERVLISAGVATGCDRHHQHSRRLATGSHRLAAGPRCHRTPTRLYRHRNCRDCADHQLGSVLAGQLDGDPRL
jgi:hypothetical protein